MLQNCDACDNRDDSHLFLVQQIKVTVYQYKGFHPQYNAKKIDYGSNTLSDEQVAGGFVFEPDPSSDVSVIVGPKENGRSCLVLCRFHKLKYPTISKSVQESLYDELAKIAGNGKFLEHKRKGGSCGKPRYDQEFMEMLGTDALFPRPSKHVIVVKRKKGWAGYYVTPFCSKKDPNDPNHPYRVTKFEYAPPVRGGSFRMPTQLIVNYPFLHEFAEKKLIAARIIQHLEALPKKGLSSKVKFNTIVAPAACRNELTTYTVSKRMFDKGTLKTQRKKSPHKDLDDKMHILISIMQLNNFTMVCHPVGLHNDVFSAKQDSLENKRTFSHTGISHTIGRGGNGWVFTWALLDWRNQIAGRRRGYYLELGGNPQVRVLPPVWNNFLVADNHRNLNDLMELHPHEAGGDVIPEHLRELSQQYADAHIASI